ncbi:MAG: HAD family hydrolase [Candidatus Gastranaerophilales bacterium]|nr:HAD family hydrolase [Candidatus Gastranaerophilales bacterium]
MQKSAVFLDRDGTLIVEIGYLSNPDQLELYKDSAESIKKLNDTGILSILVTNQSGVARGYFGEDTVNLLNQKLLNVLKEKNAYLDAIYYCPHHKKGIIEEYAKDCDCRKPKTGLINQAVADFKDINLEKSYVIGDKICDIELARNAGCKGILLKTGYGTQILNEPCQDFIKPDYVAENMTDAVDWLLDDLKNWQ